MIDLDYRSPDFVCVDFETQSTVDLRKQGGRRYAADPSTRIMCCSFVSGDRKTVWVNQEACPHVLPSELEGFGVHRSRELPPWVVERVKDGATLVGHNSSEFDAWIWMHKNFPRAKWRDTLPLCRAAALPAGLDGACEVLFGLHKDPRGKVLDVLCRAQVKGGRVVYPVGATNAWLDLVAYCASDGVLLDKLHAAVLPFAEHDVLRVSQAVNDRGIPIDQGFAARLVMLQDELAVKSGSKVAEITDEDLEMHDVRSAMKVKRWLESKGCRLPFIEDKHGEKKQSLNRDAMKMLLAHPEDFCDDENSDLVMHVLRLRQDVVRVTTGKAIRMIDAGGDDGRARGQIVYHKAHTGRYAGREIQPHNFPRGIEKVSHDLARIDLTLAEVEAEAERLKCAPGDVISTLLRPVISLPNGEIAVGDFANVEARGTDWVCGQHDELEIFADPYQDVYIDLAKKLYPDAEKIDADKRKKAKLTFLGCQYGMSARKFGAQLKGWGEDDSEADYIVNMYRQTHGAVTIFWKWLDMAMIKAVEGEDVLHPFVTFKMRDGNLEMRLPSGRRIVYREALVEEKTPYWAELQGRHDFKKPTVTYRHVRGWRATLYGGRCFAADTKVRTLRGDLDIVNVLSGDHVWDGVEWVKTSGLIFKGKKEVGEWLGVRVTADHLITDGKNWSSTILLDDRATERCLEWAASSETSSCWRICTCQDTGNLSGVCAMAAAKNASCQNGRSYVETSTLVQDVHDLGFLGQTTTDRSYRTPISSGNQCVDFRWPSEDVITRRVTSTKAMARVASRCVICGGTILPSSCDISSRSKDGTTRTLTWTGSRTTLDMDLVTSDLSQGQKTTGTEGTRFSSNIMDSGCTSSSSGSASVQTFRRLQSGIGSRTCRRTRSWREASSTCVYDLLNCGPRHRYTIVTDRGPVVVHNCLENLVQGFCRDFLTDALVRAEDAGMRPFLHVHDEIVCEEPDHMELARLMSLCPEWAPGFPMMVETFRSRRYFKKPGAKDPVVKFMLGKEVPHR